MLTGSTDGVDAGPPGLWSTVSDLAKRLGTSKQAVSKRVERFENAGALSTRAGPRGTKLVNIAEFDKAAGQLTDAVRRMNGSGSESPPQLDLDAKNQVLAVEQARNVAYQADLRKLDLDERLGKLLPIEDVEAAMVRVAEAMVRTIEQLPSKADDLAAAVAKDGTNGARAFLKVCARDLRELLGARLRLLETETKQDEAAESEAT